jgi:hypothetical protein
VQVLPTRIYANPFDPQQVFDIIICELHGDLDALKACFITSSTLFSASCKLLFSVVCLDSASFAQRLHHLILLHPEILSYVKDHHLIPETSSGEASWLTHNKAVPLLIEKVTKLPRLSLGMTRYSFVPRVHLSYWFQSALRYRLKSPYLASVDFILTEMPTSVLLHPHERVTLDIQGESEGV